VAQPNAMCVCWKVCIQPVVFKGQSPFLMKSIKMLLFVLSIQFRFGLFSKDADAFCW